MGLSGETARLDLLNSDSVISRPRWLKNKVFRKWNIPQGRQWQLLGRINRKVHSVIIRYDSSNTLSASSAQVQHQEIH